MTALSLPIRDEREYQPIGAVTYDVVRVALGGLLLAAAALKAQELLSGPVTGKGLLAWRPLLIAAVESELVLGLCLAAGLWRKTIWGVTLACFTAFSCITLYKLLSGESSCGCFGRVTVNPRHTLMLDLVSLAALLVYRPTNNQWAGSPRAKVIACAVIAMILGIPGGIAMAMYRPAALSEEGEISGGSVVVLEPSEWMGKAFPLAKHVDIGSALSRGKCMVMFYHHDCPDCQAVIPRLIEGLSTGSDGADAVRVYFIEVPPYGVLPGEYDVRSASYAFGRLSNQVEWFIQTPTAVVLRDGVVVDRVSELGAAEAHRALALLNQ